VNFPLSSASIPGESHRSASSRRRAPTIDVRAGVFSVVVLLAGCGGGGSATPPAGSPPGISLSARIKHVIVVVQENRTVDNLFNGYPGADTASVAPQQGGTMLPLATRRLEEGADPSHTHAAFLANYDYGRLDGFGAVGAAVVPRDESAPYWNLAQQFAFGDRMFQSNTGPSFPAHLYLIAGDARRIVSNPFQTQIWGCDNPSVLVEQLDPADSGATDVPGPQPQPVMTGPPVAPCFDMPTLGDVLDARAVSWKYYAPAIGVSGFVWSAYDAIRHVRFGADWASVISPETTVLADIANRTLPQVSFVVPSGAASDHAGGTDGSGPDWVASIANSLGTSPYWSDTALIVTWDDWGGFYDHVKPPRRDNMGMGFRVPLIVASPYAKRGYVSHTVYEFGSIVRLIEDIYGLPPLGGTDSSANSLSDLFDTSQIPGTYRQIATKRHAQYFLSRKLRTKEPPPDSD
jgi:phospholipase C